MGTSQSLLLCGDHIWSVSHYYYSENMGSIVKGVKVTIKSGRQNNLHYFSLLIKLLVEKGKRLFVVSSKSPSPLMSSVKTVFPIVGWGVVQTYLHASLLDDLLHH